MANYVGAEEFSKTKPLVPYNEEDVYNMPLNFDMIPKIKKEEIIKVRELGKGAFGDVYEATFQNSKVAVKELNIFKDESKSYYKRWIREISLHSKCNNEFFVPLVGISFLQDEYYNIVLKLLETDLETHINTTAVQNRFSKKKIIQNAIRIAKGLNHMHNLGIAHRDLTCSNILLDSDGLTFIADFGMSRDDKQATDKTQWKPKYSPPEWRERSTIHADVYQFGLLLWEMLSYLTVYSDLSHLPGPELADKVHEGQLVPPLNHIPTELHTMLSQCWKRIPGERISSQEIVDNLVAYEKTLV